MPLLTPSASQAPPGRPRCSRARLRACFAALLTLWSALYLSLVVTPAARATTNGFAAYYTAAHVLVHTPASMERVYDDAWFAARIERAGISGVYDIFHVQPPTMSLLLVPFAWLPPAAARIAWIAVSLLLLPAGLLLLARALGLPARLAAWVLPFCLLYAPITENLRNGQAYLLLFFLLCLLFAAILDGRRRFAGGALGSMFVCKSAGLWLWPLLACQRRWSTLAWAVLVAAGAALLTLPWIGLDAWAAYLSHLPRLATMPERTVTAYQTVTSLFGHLFVYHPRWNPVPVADLPLLAGALTLLTLAASLALSVRLTRRAGSTAAPLALALFFTLLAPTAPLGEGYHYLLTLPSLLVAAWHAWSARVGWVAWLLLLLAAILIGAPLPYTAPRLQAGWLALLAYPRVYGAYLLWAWLSVMSNLQGWQARYRWHKRRTAP